MGDEINHRFLGTQLSLRIFLHWPNLLSSWYQGNQTELKIKELKRC